MSVVIDSFRGTYEFLSNFHPCFLYYEGIDYPSSEHAYQASKFEDKEIKKLFSTTAGIKSPGAAKLMAKLMQSHQRKDFAFIKEAQMSKILRLKFSPFGRNVDLCFKLISTNDAEIIEGNNWHDYFWGVCDGHGQNRLGHILMDIRAELMKQYTYWNLENKNER